jgi:predicted nucleic acid-binding protein
MSDPSTGPFLFDTSAESWLVRAYAGPARDWLFQYLSHHLVHVSAATVMERIRGYALLWRKAAPERRAALEAARAAYISALGRVWPIDAGTAVVAGEIMALLPLPPATRHGSHLAAESRQERLVRWRFDCIIAATALTANLPLVHNNPTDFEAIRGAIENDPLRFPGLGPLQLFRCQTLSG